MTTPDEIRLLLIASREYAETIQGFLAETDISLFAVDRADELVDALRRARPTVVAVDCVTPGMNGPATFHWLRTDGGAAKVPAMLITVGKSQHKVGADGDTAAVDFVDLPMQQADFVLRVRALHHGSSVGEARPAAPAPAYVEPGRAQPSTGKTVMIVEDDADHSNLVRTLLEAEGYNVVECAGIDAFKTAILKKPDVMVLDLMMPIVDGFVLAEVFKACRLTRHIPIIFLTALHDSQYVEASRDLQAAAFLTKPVTIAHFLGTLSTVLGGRVRA